MTASHDLKLPITLFWGSAAMCWTSSGFIMWGLLSKSSQDLCHFLQSQILVTYLADDWLLFKKRTNFYRESNNSMSWNIWTFLNPLLNVFSLISGIKQGQSILNTFHYQLSMGCSTMVWSIIWFLNINWALLYSDVWLQLIFDLILL